MGDSCSFHHPETERRHAEARSFESHKAKNELIENLERDLKRVEEERDALQEEFQWLAEKTVYKGNSVSFIYDKMTVYRNQVFAVCEAFRTLGYKGEFGEIDTLPQRLQEFADSIKRHISADAYLLTELGYVECEGCGNWILKAHLEKYNGICYICSDGRSEEDREMDARAEAAVSTQAPKQEITTDQECWLESRIKKAIAMTLAIQSKCPTQEDEVIYEKAFDGIIDSTIDEILNIFNLTRDRD